MINLCVWIRVIATGKVPDPGSLKANDTTLLEVPVKVPDPGSLKANDTTLLEVPVKVPHSVLVSLARDIGADWDIDYELEVGLTIDLPIIGDFTIPLSTKGEIKLPSISDIF
jgi:hypothetical protein